MITNAIKKQYNSRTVLDVGELSFEKGKIYCLIGSNGSGKSTLSKILAGVEENDLKLSIWQDENPPIVTYAPQSGFVFSLSVEKNIMLSINREDAAVKELMKKLIKKLELQELLSKNAKTLSGGEAGKMILIRALMRPADLLILDEPMAALDVYSIPKGEAAIKEYMNIHKAAVIMITHSIRQAKRMADEVIFLDKGKIVESGESVKLLSDPSSEELKNFMEFNAI